jgi:hypothetical protein
MRTCQVCGKPNTDDARFCFSCGASLSQAPPVKVDIKSPLASIPPTPGVPPMHMGRQPVRSGSCYYHTDLPSTYVCSRCGRSICVGCNKQYGILNFCPECYWGLAPKIGSPLSPYQTMYQPMYQQPQEQSRWPF